MNIRRVALMILAGALPCFLVAACEPAGVGDPCTPEVQPPEGQTWAYGEVSVETRSLQCRTRTCMVYHFFPAGREPGEPDWRVRDQWPLEDTPQEPCRNIETQEFITHFCKMRRTEEGYLVRDMDPPLEHPEWFCNFDMALLNSSQPFCTLKCAGAGRTFGCPEGFHCEEVVTLGPEGMRGSYCIPTRIADCDTEREGTQDCCETQ
jgi:hypothetical protein